MCVDALEGKKVVVTGGAGFIGSNLVKAIYKSNEVDVVDSMRTGKESNLPRAAAGKGFKLFRDDARNIGLHCSDSEIIFHMGSYSSSKMYGEKPSLVGETLSVMMSVLEYARKYDSAVILASSASVYNGIAPPHREDATLRVRSLSGEANIASERLGKLYSDMYGMDITAMRLFSVYGFGETSKGEYANPVSQFIWAVKSRMHPIVYGDGSQRRDFVFVSDVVNALMKAVGHRGFDIFNVGTGQNYSLNELLEKIYKQHGSAAKPRYEDIPMKNYLVETLADTTKASEILGFRAEVSLDQGISMLLGK